MRKSTCSDCGVALTISNRSRNRLGLLAGLSAPLLTFLFEIDFVALITWLFPFLFLVFILQIAYLLFAEVEEDKGRATEEQQGAWKSRDTLSLVWLLSLVAVAWLERYLPRTIVNWILLLALMTTPFVFFSMRDHLNEAFYGKDGAFTRSKKPDKRDA